MSQPPSRDFRRTWLTTTLVGINVAVYLWMIASGVSAMSPNAFDLAHFGGNVGVLVFSDGQYWRLFTSMFVHAGLLHIGMNMWCLWSIGRFLERGFGVGFVLFAYFVSGLIGSLAAAALNPDTVTVGASGAIFGLYGCLLGFLLRHREQINPRAFVALRNSAGSFVLFNLLFSFAVPGISIAAHLGGVIGGFVIGLVKPWRPPAQGAS